MLKDHKILTIAGRELMCLFYSPIAYIVLALFSLGLTLIFFQYTLYLGGPADMRFTFGWVIWLLMSLSPAISMRLISEELSSGTIELLMTAPISDAQVVLGKWIGAFIFLVTIILIPLSVLAGVLEYASDPHWGPILMGTLGIVLVAGLFLAIGLFASAISKNQIIAWVFTLFLICIFSIAIEQLATADFLNAKVAMGLSYLNVNRHFLPFTKGILNSASLVYFITGTFLFLFFATLTLQSKRWR